MHVLEKANIEAESQAETATRSRDRLFGRTVIKALKLIEALPLPRPPKEALKPHTEAPEWIPRKNLDFPEGDTGKHHIIPNEAQMTVDTLLERHEWEQQFDPSEIAELDKKNAHYRMALKDVNIMVAPDEVYGTASYTPPIPGNKMPSDSDSEKAFKAIPPADYQIPRQHPHNTN